MNLFRLYIKQSHYYKSQAHNCFNNFCGVVIKAFGYTIWYLKSVAKKSRTYGVLLKGRHGSILIMKEDHSLIHRKTLELWFLSWIRRMKPNLSNQITTSCSKTEDFESNGKCRKQLPFLPYNVVCLLATISVASLQISCLQYGFSFFIAFFSFSPFKSSHFPPYVSISPAFSLNQLYLWWI